MSTTPGPHTYGYYPPPEIGWGVIGSASKTTSSGVLSTGTWTDIGVQTSVNVKANRLYRIIYKSGAWSDTTSSQVALGVMDGTGTLYDQTQIFAPNAGNVGFSTGQAVFSKSSDQVMTFKLQMHVQGGTNVKQYASSTIVSTLVVEDIGPA